MPTPDAAPEFEVVPKEASYWWRTNDVAGTILHRLMLLFIFVPLGLLYYELYLPSFIVFCGMVPYGLLLERLAQRSVMRLIRNHPETLEEFERDGVVVKEPQSNDFAEF